MENEDLIRKQMEATRTSLSDKLETLENKFLNTVQDATSAVNETVTSVRESMHEGVETVKDFVDVKAHADRHPWAVFGGSVLCGYLVANLFTGGKASRSSTGSSTGSVLPVSKGHQGDGNGRQKLKKQPIAEASQGWLSTFEPELNQLKSLAVGTTLGTVREMVAAELAPHLAGQLREMIDSITRKIGGEPIPSSDLALLRSSSGADQEHSEAGSFEKPRWEY